MYELFKKPVLLAFFMTLHVYSVNQLSLLPVVMTSLFFLIVLVLVVFLSLISVDSLLGTASHNPT